MQLVEKYCVQEGVSSQSATCYKINFCFMHFDYMFLKYLVFVDITTSLF